MSNITTYPGIPVVAGGDLMIISDTSTEGNPTRSVSVSQLGAYIGATGGGAGVSSVNGLSGALTLTPGTNVTFTGVGNNIIINAAGGGGGSSPWIADTNGITYSGNVGIGVASLSSYDLRVGSGAYIAGDSYFSNIVTFAGGIKDNGGSLGAPNQVLTTDGIDVTWATPSAGYDANEVGFWIFRSSVTNAIQLNYVKDRSSTDSTTFSIAEEGTITGAFIITASTDYFDVTDWWLTMNINCPVSYLVSTKQVVKRAHVNRLNSTQLQVEFFQETSSSTEILERVDLVVADTTAPNAAQGIDLRVKRWPQPQ